MHDLCLRHLYPEAWIASTCADEETIRRLDPPITLVRKHGTLGLEGTRAPVAVFGANDCIREACSVFC